MKVSAPRIILILTAGCALGLSAGWYVVSGKTVENARDFIANVMNQPHADGGRLTVTYDAIERAGFPYVGVRLVNPVLSFEQAGDGQNVPPMQVVWKRTGIFEMVTQTLAHAYRLRSNGTSEVMMRVGEDTQRVSSAQSHGELLIKARTSEGFKLWQGMDWSKGENLLPAIAQVGSLHLAASPITITDDKTGAVLLSQGESLLDVANRSTDTGVDVDVSAGLKDSQVTKEYNAFIQQTLRLLKLPTDAIGGDSAFAAERAGKQTMELALSVKFPRKREPETMPSGEIHVRKFAIANDFYTLSLPLDLVSRDENGAHRAVLRLNWAIDVKPAATAETKLLLDRTDAVPFSRKADGSMTTLPPAMKEKIFDVLPTLSSLGPVNFALDIETTSAPGGAAAKAVGVTMEDMPAKISLHNLTLNHARWGLESKAEAERSDHGTSVNASILCKQCNSFTSDSMATAFAVDAAMKENDPANEGLPITADSLAKLDAVLAEIGQKDAASGSITFTITSPQPGDFRLYGLPIAEQMAKLSAVFAPSGAEVPAQ